ncbi:MAG: sensor histidine kinase [Planctomycetaceae bacterium]
MSAAERSQPFPWKAAAPSLAVSGVLLSVTVCAASVLFINQRSTTAALAEATQGFNAAVDLELGVRTLRGRLAEYVQSGDSSNLGELAHLHSSAAGCMERVQTIIITPEGRYRIESLRRSMSNLDEQLHAAQAIQQEERRRQVLRAMGKVLDENVLKDAAAQRESTQTVLAAAQRESAQLTAWTGWGLLTLGLAGTAAGVLSGFSLARGWHRQLVDLSVSVRSAAGSLEPVTGQLPLVAVEPSGDLTHVQSMVDLLALRVGEVVRRLQSAERETLRRDQLAALGQLAAGLAHELRNPLTSIKTLVEAAREPGPESGLDDRDLDVIGEEINRLDTTLQSFLDYARPPKLIRRQVDVREIIARTIQLVTPRAERQHVYLEQHLPAEPITAIVDPEQLRQVLLNLLLNAVDALTSGGQVTVSLTTVEADRVQLSIEDNGPGIPDTLLPKLFEPFVSTKPSGTGLGLTICHRIVENHGGELVAENRVPHGARFVLTLPRHAEQTPTTLQPDYACSTDH